MAASVKAILNCIGIDTSARVSILGDFFGFFRARVPADPCTNTPARVNLLTHIQSLRGLHVHLNIIRVGIDNFTAMEIDKIDYSILRARQIYRTVSLGIGRIEHFDVTAAQAGGKDDIGSEAEAKDLTHDFPIPNDGIDVFMVDNISASFVGLSPIEGPCDKNSARMTGVLGGEVNRSFEGVARSFAHEIGHFLGLPHNHGDNCPTTDAGRANLMAQTRCASNICTSVVLTGSQGTNARDHCSIQQGC